jgi:hypothetical protein
MGIDLVALLLEMADWRPAPPSGSDLPNDAVRAALNEAMLRSIGQVTPRRMFFALFGHRLRRLGRIRAWKALFAYARLRRRLARPAGGPPGYRSGSLPWVDPLLRDRIERIFDSAFPREPEDAWGEPVRRSESLAAWVTEPLGR